MNIKDYLHLYMGCLAEVSFMAATGMHTMTTTITPHALEQKHWRIKPLLRPLSDISPEESMFMQQYFTSLDNNHDLPGAFKEAERTRHMLSRRFDLFGLIPAGLAIDKTKQPAV